MPERADHLLCCAVAYHQTDVSAKEKMGATYASTTDGVRAMMDCLWYEAKVAMSAPIDAPEEPYLHPVDVDTDEPGIVASREKRDAIHRRKLPLPRVVYANTVRSKRPSFCAPKPKTLEEALQDAEKEDRETQKKARTRAKRETRAEERSIEKMHAAEERKRQREAETPAEREQRLAEQRAKREERKRAREEEAAAAAAERASGQVEEAEAEAEDAEDAEAEQGGGEEEAEGSPVVVDLQDLLEEDSAAVPSTHGVIPPRIKARGSKVHYFTSPVPFDRHLAALERVHPHPNLERAVLNASHSNHLVVVRGPPGTGKTSAIVDQLLPRFDAERVFVCAPTNVGAANVYARIISRYPTSALVLPPSKIPPGTPCTSQNPSARIVCATVSGRSGRMLDDEEFGVVIVDEAAQCMEAWLWSLLRPEVHTLIMVGDTRQLPATVSQDGVGLGHDISLMQRLVDLEYPTQQLTTQRRMHPEIVDFPNRAFYEGALRTEYSAPDHGIAPYEVVHVEGECKRIGTSFCNTAEASVCVDLARTLGSTFERVVIVCPYQAQTRELLRLGGTNVHTIDSFQGQEADAVIISVVRREDIGFWSDVRRLNVALTRARHCLRVVGAQDAWTGILKDLANDARRRDLVRANN